ncbi:hypothetical protein ES703_110590 [subsurface metagenome]
MKRYQLLILATLLSIASCENSSEPKNHAPEIISITASPASPPPNYNTTISVVATDKDGDILSYTFSAEYGHLSQQEESSIIWRATEPGNYSVHCIVSDGVDTANSSIAIQVI